MMYRTRHRRLSADRFYWAELDTSQLGHRWSVTRKQVGYLFEAFLPVPIEEVQATYVHCRSNHGQQRWIACGMRRMLLENELGPDVTALYPDSLPGFLDVGIEPSRLNLLHGDFEPVPVRRSRRYTVTVAVASLLLAVVLVVAGLEGRVRSMRQQAAAFHEQRIALIQNALVGRAGSKSDQDGTSGGVRTDSEIAPSTTASASRAGGAAEFRQQGGQPPMLRLAAELRQLRRTRSDTVPEPEAADITAPLANLLAIWPVRIGDSPESTLNIQTELLSVTPTAMTVRAIVPSTDAATELAESLSEIEGWSSRQPQINSQRDSVRMVLRFDARQSKEDA